MENDKIEKIEEYREVHLNQVSSEEMLIECLEWVHEHLCNIAGMLSYETSNCNDRDSNYTFPVC
jgi:hypothetical protein